MGLLHYSVQQPHWDYMDKLAGTKDIFCYVFITYHTGFYIKDSLLKYLYGIFILFFCDSQWRSPFNDIREFAGRKAYQAELK